MRQLDSHVFENPELYVSHDGLNWYEPADGVNPVATLPSEAGRRDLKKEYHSDSSLLLHEGVLHLYYRWTGRLLDGSEENRIYLKTSKDGIKWSGRVSLLEEKAPADDARKFLSPSVLFADGKFTMWTVEYDGPVRSIVRRTSRDGLTWSLPEAMTVYADYSMQAPWHLDVLGEGGRYLLILTTAGDRGFDAGLHLGFGEEGDPAWRMAGKLIEPGYFFEGKRVYRSTIVSRGDDVYYLYYSAMSENGTWNVARVGLKIDGDAKTFTYEE